MYGLPRVSDSDFFANFEDIFIILKTKTGALRNAKETNEVATTLRNKWDTGAKLNDITKHNTIKRMSRTDLVHRVDGCLHKKVMIFRKRWNTKRTLLSKVASVENTLLSSWYTCEVSW